MDLHTEELPQYIHINQNEFFMRRHKKQKEEDIAICECRFDADDPDSACGDSCLNVLTSTECTPGHCPCDILCKNQKFQKCEYAKTKLFKTEGRGWGLLADEDIKAGQFVIEYCGEVISWKEAKRRSQTYEIQGLKDAFIICLNASESIDATRKGSLARFINHSWFAASVVHLSVLDSLEQNLVVFRRILIYGKMTMTVKAEQLSESTAFHVQPLDSVQMKGLDVKKIKTDVEGEDMNLYSNGTEQTLSQKNAMISRIRDNAAGRNYRLGPRSMSTKRSRAYNGGRFKNLIEKKVDAKFAAGLLASKEAQGEILNCEKRKDDATSALDSLYDEIRPAIEEHERDSQDSVSTTVAEKWIQACCLKLKAEFDLYSSIVKNVACTAQKAPGQAKPPDVDNNENEIKLLTDVSVGLTGCIRTNC
ncbi:histone-lysine N-methyltransferase ASHH1 isoform X3 [Cajanus cajan]|uniref:histone-lysine N-methyltransferase ASHH1 isoform X3 n=1 Tax=Cajanus cajan TaxID=3821 RepID=UPI00098DA5FC|nr:histone-lysine N-methyltransferase ASHH1 isoform X3 [Cajanus cajan]